MRYGLISGDNHIALTYCPPDLWSSQAPAKWKLLAPRVEELEDGLHWFVEGQDQGMWNGVGPRFRSEEHTSELQSRPHLVCRLLLEKKNKYAHNTREYMLRRY